MAEILPRLVSFFDASDFPIAVPFLHPPFEQSRIVNILEALEPDQVMAVIPLREA
ncbi:hypothetical protein FHS61_001707 [Altererythrobacter atlanticus]|nr:hypothetical protein [Croceibacterium atlanticum]